MAKDRLTIEQKTIRKCRVKIANKLKRLLCEVDRMKATERELMRQCSHQSLTVKTEWWGEVVFCHDCHAGNDEIKEDRDMNLDKFVCADPKGSD